ncbi:cytochrome c oxidase assembly protein COX16 homolog, mitochondrial [Macrosteles quadrilineatus]|uniref:cytochrome c oxidase assembly protein COX16 homolog, mitochondrial n=1 Tax=Macrosteles quadrilineatus TaxID=74068 RepID=UPI0023E184E0|nr:cytochrome c oxidase assembly protein COX16 homolog, mitochondrial [Macrosteles quadrilineatus]
MKSHFMPLFNKEKLLLFLEAKSKNKLLKYSAPFFLLVLGGSVFLKQFTNLRYEYSSTQRNLKPEEIEGLKNLKKPGEVTLEKEYEKMKEMDIDTWTNKRGPRPWEDSQES